MKKSTNGTVLEPPGIIERDVTKSKTYKRIPDRSKSNIIEKQNILRDKELIIMTSISIVWFVTFFYFLLFVFT